MERAMPEDESKGQKSVVVATSAVPTIVPLGPSASIDLSWLSETERKALLTDYVRGALDISKKAQDLHVDVGVLKNTLQTLADTTKEVAESGNAVTITHTQTTSIGRTEIMMGNTERAQSGKLSRSQSGEHEWTPYYILAAIIALVIIIALLAK
jgi:hypothetical protein